MTKIILTITLLFAVGVYSALKAQAKEKPIIIYYNDGVTKKPDGKPKQQIAFDEEEPKDVKYTLVFKDETQKGIL